jgi:adenylosuccinate synthase
VVFPWHIEEDRLLNESADGEQIGTTLRGIGPCYRDKVGRSHAIRLGDLCRDDLAEKIERIAAVKQRLLKSLNGREAMDLEPAKICREYVDYAERLRPHIGDTTAYLLDAVDRQRPVLFEGGGGPFPTEQNNDVGELIRRRGNEYGTTTGRPRRCGWFDAPAVRYAARLSGVDLLSVMMLDVLSQMSSIRVCVAYQFEGQLLERFPGHVDDLRRITPVYEELPGWQQEITGARRMEDLPDEARGYLDRISQLIGRPVGIVSVGPDREQTIFSETGRKFLGRP